MMNHQSINFQMLKINILSQVYILKYELFHIPNYSGPKCWPPHLFSITWINTVDTLLLQSVSDRNISCLDPCCSLPFTLHLLVWDFTSLKNAFSYHNDLFVCQSVRPYVCLSTYLSILCACVCTMCRHACPQRPKVLDPWN